MELKEFCEKLINKAKKIDVDIEEKQAEKYYNYMNYLLEWNEKINLTAITDPEEIILKHFIDSLTVLKYVGNKSKIIDVGTGAGFPGIPLSIMNIKNNYTLLDSLNKRINFLNGVIDLLELNNVETIHSRVEDFGKDKKYRECFDIAISRAVAPLNILLEYLLPLVKIDGYCICMKGQNEEEIKEAEKAIEILGGKIEKIDKLVLPDSDINRNIIIVRKIKNTPKQYPRKAGIPSKEPIK